MVRDFAEMRARNVRQWVDWDIRNPYAAGAGQVPLLRRPLVHAHRVLPGRDFFVQSVPAGLPRISSMLCAARRASRVERTSEPELRLRPGRPPPRRSTNAAIPTRRRTITTMARAMASTSEQ